VKQKNKEVWLRANDALKTKVANLREDLKETRAETRKLRKTLVRKEASLERWKSKAKSRLTSYNDLKNKPLNHLKLPTYSYPLLLMQLAIQFRILCGCSYGSIVKILEVLAQTFDWKLGLQSMIPCGQSLQNWVRKVGLYQLQQADLQLKMKEVCVIVDESIRVGTEKLLLVLVCPAGKATSQALTHQDVQVLTLQGAHCWKAAQIAKEIQSALEEKGFLLKYFLSDQAGNLKKAAQLLGVPHVADITHACSTSLQKTFSQNSDYKGFIAAVGKLQAKLALGKEAYLRPPKQRVKARFMNQYPLVHWGKCVNQKWKCLSEKAQEKLRPVYQTYDELLRDLSESIETGKKIATLLKNKGISLETIGKAKAELATLSCGSSQQCYQKYLKGYLQEYENVLNKLPQTQVFHACSDVIESLFGKYKAHASDNFFVGVTSLSLEISLFTLTPERLRVIIPNALTATKMTDLKNWKGLQDEQNQTVKRREFLKT